MLLTSTTGLVILALVLIAGWLLGLASSSGGKKWKARYVAERDAHAAYRKDADARVSDAVRRHADLERDHARATTATPVAQPVAAQPVVAQPVVAQPVAAQPVAHPADVHAADVHRGSDRSIPPISSTVITPDRSRDRL